MSVMPANLQCAEDGFVAPDRFSQTQWMIVNAAASESNQMSANEAWARLYETYWNPLYAFVRSWGYEPEDAEDLTQAFFAHLVEHHGLAKVDQTKGKFHSFLLGSLRHFLANEWDRAHAAKRGSGLACVSLEAAADAERFALEPSEQNSPDKILERNWALAVMEESLRQLRTEQELAGKGPQFRRLQECLMGDPDAPRYADLAADLGMSADALKQVVSRLRRRYRDLLRHEIARLVNNPKEIDEEIQRMFVLLGS